MTIADPSKSAGLLDVTHDCVVRRFLWLPSGSPRRRSSRPSTTARRFCDQLLQTCGQRCGASSTRSALLRGMPAEDSADSCHAWRSAACAAKVRCSVHGFIFMRGSPAQQPAAQLETFSALWLAAAFFSLNSM